MQIRQRLCCGLFSKHFLYKITLFVNLFGIFSKPENLVKNIADEKILFLNYSAGKSKSGLLEGEGRVCLLYCHLTYDSLVPALLSTVFVYHITNTNRKIRNIVQKWLWIVYRLVFLFIYWFLTDRQITNTKP